MILEVYSVYDKVEKRYSSPFTSPSKEVCLRMARDQIETLPHPNDKQLVHIGYFDTEVGILTEVNKKDQLLHDPVDLSIFTGGAEHVKDTSRDSTSRDANERDKPRL